jgi:hypothetical protein
MAWGCTIQDLFGAPHCIDGIVDHLVYLNILSKTLLCTLHKCAIAPKPIYSTRTVI